MQALALIYPALFRNLVGTLYPTILVESNDIYMNKGNDICLL